MMILYAFGIAGVIILISIILSKISVINRIVQIKEDPIILTGKLQNTYTSIKNAVEYLELTNSFADKM